MNVHLYHRWVRIGAGVSKSLRPRPLDGAGINAPPALAPVCGKWLAAVGAELQAHRDVRAAIAAAALAAQAERSIDVTMGRFATRRPDATALPGLHGGGPSLGRNGSNQV